MIRTAIRGKEAWATEMKSHYGYIKGTEGKDGDHLDVFFPPGTPEDYAGPVFVVNQMRDSNDTAFMEPRRTANGGVTYVAVPKKVFDEHKAVFGPGIDSQYAAGEEYRKNYAEGWEVGEIARFDTVEAFKEWYSTGDLAKPAPIIKTPDKTPDKPQASSPPEPEKPPLPKDISGAKPRYAYRQRQFQLNFETEFDKAAYITAQAEPSKRNADYLNWAVGFSGMSADRVIAHGEAVKAAIKQMAKEAEAAQSGNDYASSSTLFIPDQTATAPAPAPAPPVAAPKAPEPAPAPEVTAPAPAPAPAVTAPKAPAKGNVIIRTFAKSGVMSESEVPATPETLGAISNARAVLKSLLDCLNS